MRLQFVIEVQDTASKNRFKIMIISVPIKVHKHRGVGGGGINASSVKSQVQSPTSRFSRSEISKQMQIGMVGMPVTETHVGHRSF